MKRLLAVIVVALFGLAAMSGPTIAAGAASGNFWSIANQELCFVAAASVVKTPVFKPCSKKINGHSISCQQMAAILLLLGAGVFQTPSVALIWQNAAVVTISTDSRRFRPPQAS